MIGLTLACAMVCSLAMPVSADDVLFNVDCSVKDSNAGSDVWASLDNDGVLTISGTGRMDSYIVFDEDSERPDYPWLADEYKSSVTTIVIEDGVTFVDVGSTMPELKNLYFPNTLEFINPFDWVLCTKLETAFIPAGIDTSESGDIFQLAADNFTIYGYKGTSAEEYAGTYEYSFRAMGDMDADNVIDLSDASEILSLYAGIAAGNTAAADSESPDAADVDQDGVVGLSDASCVISYYAQNAAGLAADWNELMSW